MRKGLGDDVDITEDNLDPFGVHFFEGMQALTGD
jgi:hypothetical protein